MWARRYALSGKKCLVCIADDSNIALIIYRCQEPQLQVENDSQPAQQLQTENRRSQERRMAVKCSVSSIGWNPAYADALNDLVDQGQRTDPTYLHVRTLPFCAGAFR